MNNDTNVLLEWLRTRIGVLELLGRTSAGVLTSDDEKVLASYQLALHALTGGVQAPLCAGDGMLIKNIMADGADKVAHNIRACLDEFPTYSHDIVEECAIFATETAKRLRAGL